MPKPKLLQKVFFWIVLGFLSTFFAETFSGSSPDFLFKTFGYFGIIPIYLLHSALLAALVMQRGKALQPAHALFCQPAVRHV